MSSAQGYLQQTESIRPVFFLLHLALCLQALVSVTTFTVGLGQPVLCYGLCSRQYLVRAVLNHWWLCMPGRDPCVGDSAHLKSHVRDMGED